MLEAGATRPSFLGRGNQEVVNVLLDESGRDVWRDEFNATMHALSALQDAYLALLRQVNRMQARVVKVGGERPAIRIEVKQDPESKAVRITFGVGCLPVNRWFRRNTSFSAALDADYQMQVLWIELAQEAARQLNGVCFEKAAMMVRFIVRTRADADAFDYVLKYVVDGLRAAGILASDTSDALLHLVEVEVGKPERVEVLLWDLESCPWATQARLDRDRLVHRLGEP
jgi:hypothetical protein